MTDVYTPTNPPEDQNSTSGVTDTAKDVAGTAKEQASQVGHDAADSAKNVAGTAKEEASKVAGETKKQAQALYEEARTQLHEQAGVQQGRVAEGLRSIGDELNRMAQASDQPGVAKDLVSQVASRTSGVASWLDERDPGSLLTEVKNYARRKPGTFIAVSAVAGLVAGRLVRSLTSEAKDEKEAAASSTPSTTTGTSTSAPAHAAPAVPVTPVPPVPPVPASTDDLYGEASPAYTDGTPTLDGDFPPVSAPAYDPTTDDGRRL
jgi:ElaB/YqjD/DUF883 family membrane-anchored ribosome-binding protein